MFNNNIILYIKQLNFKYILILEPGCDIEKWEKELSRSLQMFGLLLQNIESVLQNLQKKTYSVRDRGSPNPSLTYPIRPKPIPRNEGG